jgi:hypothetical protein
MSGAVSAGSRLACPACTTEVVVVRAGSGAGALTCWGEALVGIDAQRPLEGHRESEGEGILLGKRYTDEQSGLELLCIKAGPGVLSFDGRELTLQGAKPLPSSD